jgi:hypothetical protein
MIKLEQNNGNYFVIANNKILLATKNLSYATEVLTRAKNNDLEYASKNFIPIIRLDPSF